MPETCPCCGATVTIIGSGESTMYYQVDPEPELDRLRANAVEAFDRLNKYREQIEALREAGEGLDELLEQLDQPMTSSRRRWREVAGDP